MNSTVEQHHNKHYRKYQQIKDEALQRDVLKLPRDFTCFHFRRDVPIEERMRPVLIVALTREPGCFEYAVLEIERGILRRVK